MNPTRTIEYHNLKDVLLEYLPAEQQQYATSNAYAQLVWSLLQYLTADSADKHEAHQAFLHQKSVWFDFCEFQQKHSKGLEWPLNDAG